MKHSKKDEFFSNLGDHLGVPKDKIILKTNNRIGEFTCGGPKPERFPELPGSGRLPELPGAEHIPELPWELEYCITVVLESPPPKFLCEAYRHEYKELTSQLDSLVAAKEWEELAIVAQRLSELKSALDNFCKSKKRTITYCIFPTPL